MGWIIQEARGCTCGERAAKTWSPLSAENTKCPDETDQPQIKSNLGFWSLLVPALEGSFYGVLLQLTFLSRYQ